MTQQVVERGIGIPGRACDPRGQEVFERVLDLFTVSPFCDGTGEHRSALPSDAVRR